MNYSPTDYSVFCTDRSFLGGGVMLAILSSIPAKQLTSPPDLEIITVKLELKIPIILCLLYIPPHSNPS